MMLYPKNEGREAATSRPSQNPLAKDSDRESNKPAHKIIRVLSALTRRSWNRFEAELYLHDHCLHSTVSSIQQKYGIIIARKFERVPGYMGLPTRVCRYWFTPDQRVKALKIIGKKRHDAA